MTTLSLLSTYILFAIWQSTLCLAVSLLLIRWLAKTPWRAHVLLCTGVFAAVLAPTLSTVIALQNDKVSSGGLTDLLGGLFLAGMVLFALLLFYGVMMSRKLMFHARPFPDRESQEALLAGAKVLQNVSLPILFTSDRVKSPTVWCWGLHPAVLLPEKLTALMSAEERDAVFLHELAHITRRDHLAALFCSLSGILLFWHPLYWLALWQSDLLSDEACDLLVLSRGTVLPGDYSDILLKLAAGEKRRPVLQFLSRKEKIMKRVNTIYDFADNATLAPANPSRLWTGSVISLALLLCVGLAFCQETRKNLVTFEKYQIYEVNKSVADFKESDLSSPEAAYATLNKISASRDKDVIVQFEKYSANNLKFSQKDFDFYLNFTDDWVEIMKTAEILKVCTYADRAIVIAKFSGKETRNPYDIRWLRKIGDQWFNDGNDRVDSPDVALIKFGRFAEKEAKKAVEKSSDDTVTSLEKFLNIEGLKRYPVNKRIADFPADEIDLSSPEAAYATQKNLIVSSHPDKLERILSITVGRPKVSDISAHERRMNDEKITEEWAKIYREKFVVFEVYVLEDKYAFVFGLRLFDMLYDGNYFVKEGDEWLNNGNEQSMEAEEIAASIQRFFARNAKVAKVLRDLSPGPGTAPSTAPSPAPLGNDPFQVSLEDLLKVEGLTVYRVEKRVADMPESDLTTPENAFAAQWHKVAAGIEDKEFAKVFKNRVLVLEVLMSANKQKAFVLGYKGQSDYEGRFYTKKGNQWVKGDGPQATSPEEMAKEITQTVNKW
ncbi:MAG: M56 family metallopeptidase [Planctomycetaceae bacterium]|nr:M56 family metallopeptidase [Planctomycetaceae bacterium]